VSHCAIEVRQADIAHNTVLHIPARRSSPGSSSGINPFLAASGPAE
jgi:hypothetical protein